MGDNADAVAVVPPSFVGSRLFLSCDLVGSTSWKQSHDGWLKDFIAFYLKFPMLFAACYDELRGKFEARDNKFVADTRPILWKAVGDELIFVGQVTSEQSVSLAVRAWLGAMKKIREQVLQKEGPQRAALDLKGAAWIATFPIPDRSVAIPLAVMDAIDPDLDLELGNERLLKTTTGHTVDYLGPNIDNGFRVASKASVQKFALSVEVAWALVSDTTSSDDKPLPICYEGEAEMKGVWSGRGYPLFWVNTKSDDDLQKKLDELAGLKNVEPNQIKELAKSLQHQANWSGRIYLPHRQNPDLEILWAAEVLAESERLSHLMDTSESPLIGADGSPQSDADRSTAEAEVVGLLG